MKRSKTDESKEPLSTIQMVSSTLGQSDLEIAEHIQTTMENSRCSHNPKDLLFEPSMRFSKQIEQKYTRKGTKADLEGMNTGRWSAQEHKRFVEAIQKYGE
jgi:hypothetical protein